MQNWVCLAHVSCLPPRFWSGRKLSLRWAPCHRARSAVSSGQGDRVQCKSCEVGWLGATDDEPCLHLYYGTLYVSVAILDNYVLKALISSAKVWWSKKWLWRTAAACVLEVGKERWAAGRDIKGTFFPGLKQLLFGYCKINHIWCWFPVRT